MSDTNIIISDVCRVHFTLKGINLLQHAEDVRLRERYNWLRETPDEGQVNATCGRRHTILDIPTLPHFPILQS